MSQQSETQELITIHQRRLQKLKEKKATFGINTPPEILIEIEDIETELERLENLSNAPVVVPPVQTTTPILSLPLTILLISLSGIIAIIGFSDTILQTIGLSFLSQEQTGDITNASPTSPPASIPGPAKMKEQGSFEVTFAIAIASFGEMNEKGQIYTSSKGYDLSTQVFKMLQNEFESLPDDVKERSLLWHDSLPLTDKGKELGTILGNTPQERQTNAEKLADDIKADLIIYGNFIDEDNTSAFVPEFYVSPINGQAEEIIGHNQLGSNIPIPPNCENDPKCAFILIPELSVRTKALTRFTVGLMYDLIGSNQKALETFERTEQELTDWDEKNEGKEVLYYFIGYETLALSYDENEMKKSFPTIEAALASAEKYFLKALDSNPNYVRAYIGLGNVYYRQAEFQSPQRRLTLLDKADAHYEKALTEASKLPGIPIELMARYGRSAVAHSKGEAYLELGAKDEANIYFVWAIKEFEALLKPLSEPGQQQKLTQAYFALGAAYHGQAQIMSKADPKNSIVLFKQAEAAYTKCAESASKTINELIRTVIGPKCEEYAQRVQNIRLDLEK
jgi:tetratricopeptide (TPR) repeat protein